MQSQETPGVQYSRWNDRNQDEVSVNVSATEVSTMRSLFLALWPYGIAQSTTLFCQAKIPETEMGGNGNLPKRRPKLAAEERDMTTGRSHADMLRVNNLLCTGKIGIAMKVVAGLAIFWIIFIIGYITGYYVHKCKEV